MKLLDSIRFRIATLFRRSQMNAEIEEELRSHIQHRADDLERSGFARPEAERRARIEFGGREKYKEEAREAAGVHFIEVLRQDVRFGLRMLRKSPGFTAVAVLTLGLAIGANAVVFSAINAFFFHPLNLPEEESLYAVWRANATSAESYPDYVDLRDRNRSFDGLAGFTIALAALDTGENPTRAWGMEVSGNYFDVLRVRPSLGRFFHAADEHGPNSAPFVVLSHTYWRNHFQSDPGVVGRTVLLNRHPFTIIGVAPQGFHGTMVFFGPDIFLPMVNQEQIEGTNYLDNRGEHWVFMVLGHVKEGVSHAQAIEDLNSIGADLKKNYPNVEGNMTFSLARPGLYGDYLGRPVKMFLTGLMILAGLILLAACANLGSLFASRAAERSREVALRLALGARRWRVLRQLFTEAMLISLLGGAVGLWGSVLLLSALSTWNPFPRWPIHVAVTPNAFVYAFALLLALASGLLFGAVPIRQVLRTDPYQIVKSGSTGTIGRRLTPRDLLLVAQIAICAVLVTSSMVALRGLVRSLHGNYGFEPRNTLLADTDVMLGGYRGDRATAIQKRIVDELETIPGVQAVGLSDWTPLGADADSKGVRVFDDAATDLRPGNAAAVADRFKISPEYFRAARTSLFMGRAFTWHDDKNSPSVAVINQEFARRLFGSMDGAMGRYFKLKDGTRVQVVGIAEDGKYDHITENPTPAMFVPILQSPSSVTWLIVRSGRDPQQLAQAMRSRLRAVDSGLPFVIDTWDRTLDITFFGPRLATSTLGAMGAMGALLSIIGIFGMAAYSVSKRRKELGIRIALGAQRKEVLRAALGRPVKLLAFGSAAGLVLGILASRVLAFIVYTATPRDPLVLAGVVLAMALVGLVATWIPAQRALSIDPLTLLREE
jgi:predicted permease